IGVESGDLIAGAIIAVKTEWVRGRIDSGRPGPRPTGDLRSSKIALGNFVEPATCPLGGGRAIQLCHRSILVLSLAI
ncbi:MAG: hypothetical protein Q8L06_13450, partial [Pseudohongiella sp.]|nr:hypothetical protein [Pseudohongiella sp.]